MLHRHLPSQFATVRGAGCACRCIAHLRHCCRCNSFSLTCSSRHASTGSSGDLPPAAPPPSSATPESPSHLPQWVSTQKANGERRMSVSIRSGAQRQRARRPPHVPPYVPTSPPATPETAAGSPAPLAAVVGDPLEGVRLEKADLASPAHTATSRQRGGVPRHVASTSAAVGSTPGTSSPSSAPAPRTDVHRDTVAPTGNAQGDGSHPLLYSVSRFTEPVKRIILIRNGRSEANEDVAAYVNTPDWRIPLVEEGKRESIAAGHALSELTGDDPVYFYYSPYIRSRQSLRYVLQGFDEARLSRQSQLREWWEDEDVEGEGSVGDGTAGPALGSRLPLEAQGISTTCAVDAGLRGATVSDAVSTDPTTDTASASFLRKDASLVLNEGTSDSIIGVREDVRLRDGDIGRYTTVEELMHHLLERERYGKFFYRFPYGESGADVCDRVTSFLDAFQRERVEFPMNTNVVIITHGLTMRMFIKRWFHLTVDTFHRMKSPPPGSLCTLTRLHHRSCFRLDESCVESMHLPLSLNEYNGYKYRNKQLLGSMSSGAPYM